MAKFTNDDIDEIVTALQREKGNFAFLIGAGCSLSAGIPSGKKIAEDICNAYPYEIKPLSNEAKQNYALCMGRLPIETRKKIINGYLDSPNVKLNWAHIALACLMDQGFINRVLTFNFDNLLTRACGLLGRYPASYDFGSAPSTQPKHLVSPSILHLHGQGSGSVLLHTEEETEKHAKQIEPLLVDTFANFPMLVMGYSGESDKVFDKIKTIYKGDQALYWFGHDEHPNAELAKFMVDINGGGFCKYIGGADADEVFIKFAQKLNCFPPAVLADPAGHLLAELKDVAEFPLKEINNDILKNTLDRLHTHRKALKFNKVQTAVLQNKPTDIDANDKNINSEIAAWALIGRGHQHADLAEKTTSISEKISQFKNAAQLFEAAHKTNKNSHNALNNWGTALFNLARLQGDAELFKASIVKYEAAHKLKPDDSAALYNWGGSLTEAWLLTKDQQYLMEAAEKLRTAEELNPNSCYNGACLAAINNDEMGCKERLLRTKEAKSLPSRKHLEEDECLTNMRDKPWFKEFLKDL